MQAKNYEAKAFFTILIAIGIVVFAVGFGLGAWIF
jgi:flagellar basal body-associated protein FliL